jgi:hypothetical protein
VTTRLLALARPDVLVSVNPKSIQGLSRVSGVPVPELKRPAGYVRLIQWIIKSHWWNSPRPKDPQEVEIWNARSALLDVFVYDGEHYERASRH